MNTDLDKARQLVENIRAHLPSSISVAALGVRSKAPYLLLAAREALIWRTEELARCACDMLERDDLAAGILLTRAVTESAAFVCRLKELLETRNRYSPDELHQKFQQMLLGEKNSGLPEAVNILTLIDRMDKQIPGVRKEYDGLSEFAHPNWSGVLGLFGQHNDRLTFIQFGRGAAERSTAKEIACDLLASSLAVFDYAYNVISATFPQYLAELEPLLSPAEEVKQGGG
jgi:hypothetical protein